MAPPTWLLLLALCLPASSEAAKPCPTSGIIDLGYAKHVPTYVNATASGKRISIYKNIRFGNPPTGNLRFRLPNTDLPKVSGVQDGHVPWQATECISSAPAFVPFPDMSGKTWGHEDCLFLDVYVPEGVAIGDNVPVLHWYVGSAFAFGSKDTLMFFNPMGLFDMINNQTKFIIVANNYRQVTYFTLGGGFVLTVKLDRHGVPGWAYVPGQDMDANLGMHDCLAAAKWTSKYVDRFGGDPGRITVMGQSAGAGILSLLSVINGGREKLPFQQVCSVSSTNRIAGADKPGLHIFPLRPSPKERHRKAKSSLPGNTRRRELHFVEVFEVCSRRYHASGQRHPYQSAAI
jgi:hypothetical protein